MGGDSGVLWWLGYGVVLCCTVLCCAVLCLCCAAQCVVLCLWCVVLCCAMLYCAVQCVVLCCVGGVEWSGVVLGMGVFPFVLTKVWDD